MYDQSLQDCLNLIGINQAKEDSYRLQGVSWIDGVRKALKLYVSLIFTATMLMLNFQTCPNFQYRLRLLSSLPLGACGP